jgi:Family of unknown function (DUF5677)
MGAKALRGQKDLKDRSVPVFCPGSWSDPREGLCCLCEYAGDWRPPMEEDTMRLFPGEEDRIDEVSRHLATELEFADRLYRFWVEAPKDKWLNKSSLPETSKHLAMLLNIQVYRQFRSIVEDCRRAEAFCGNIVARSLFETTLGMLFILKPHLRIATGPFVKNGIQRTDGDGSLKYCARPLKKREVAKGCPSRELRANIYLAHSLISGPLLFKRMAAIPRMKRLGKAKAAAVDELTADLQTAYRDKIGEEWWSVIHRAPHSYSGLGVETLAGVVDRSHILVRWYETVYRAQSDIVHAADALNHGHIAEDGIFQGRYLSSDEEVCGAVQEAVMFLLICMNTCQKYISFGSGVEMALNGFLDEFHRVFPESSEQPVASIAESG